MHGSRLVSVIDHRRLRAGAIGGQSQIVRAQVNASQCRQKIPATMAPNASHTSQEPPCSRAKGQLQTPGDRERRDEG